jgi:hypothetical protein
MTEPVADYQAHRSAPIGQQEPRQYSALDRLIDGNKRKGAVN